MIHQSNFGQEFELQKRQIVLFESPRDAMQVSTPSAHSGVGSELVEWYGDATSIPYGHLLIDLSPRTDGRLRYCINTGFLPSIFFIPDQLKQSKLLADGHTKSLHSPSVPIIFPQMHNSFPSVLPKTVYPVSLRNHNKSAPGNPAKHEKTSRGKFANQCSTIVSETYNLEAKKRHSSVRKKLTSQ